MTRLPYALTSIPMWLHDRGIEKRTVYVQITRQFKWSEQLAQRCRYHRSTTLTVSRRTGNLQHDFLDEYSPTGTSQPVGIGVKWLLPSHAGYVLPKPKWQNHRSQGHTHRDRDISRHGHPVNQHVQRRKLAKSNAHDARMMFLRGRGRGRDLAINHYKLCSRHYRYQILEYDLHVAFHQMDPRKYPSPVKPVSLEEFTTPLQAGASS